MGPATGIQSSSGINELRTRNQGLEEDQGLQDEEGSYHTAEHKEPANQERQVSDLDYDGGGETEQGAVEEGGGRNGCR